ncbi:MAG: HD domain-containing protein [Firmicutes bacterium]|nr:HD domain-containing protein [Bacillota bacterium]
MLADIAAEIASAGGRAYYVGGYVRDLLLRRSPAQGEDIDIEIHDLSPADLLSILSHYGPVRQVGKAFPVLKISGHPEWDFTLPFDPHLGLESASGRRDFTINTMMVDILSGEIIDYHGGQADLHHHILRHTRPDTFQQDPVRAYRAFHLAARFTLAIHPSTLALISSLDVSQAQPERVYLEIKKMLLLAAQPSIGWRYMRSTGILQRRHPLLFALTACEQDPNHHPEGDAWEHTLLVVDRAATLRASSTYPEALMLAALLHDLGKPGATQREEDRLVTSGHDLQGEVLARQFLTSFSHHRRLIEAVALLVKEHMQPLLLYKQRLGVSDKAIRQLVNRINLRELLLLAEADFLGRGGERNFTPIRQWLLDRVRALGLQPDARIAPLVQGRDLQRLGIPPGPAYGPLLSEAFDQQLEGKSKAAILQTIQATLSK